MHIPKYWFRAESSLPQTRTNITRWGWSDQSEEEAKKHAMHRLDEAIFSHSQKTESKKQSYTIAKPIREQIITDMGNAIITQNRYGAYCLNTNELAIADVDFDMHPSKRYFTASGTILALVAFFLLLLVPFWSAYFSLFLLLVGLLLLPKLPIWLWKWTLKQEGGIESYCLRRLDEFLKQHPEWIVDVYRTPHGLRYIVLHRPMTTEHPDIQRWFKWVKADRLYARLCHTQKVFRARLSPKPWRIHMASIPHPRWPALTEHELDERNQWNEQYKKSIQGYSACRYLGRHGPFLQDSIVHPLCATLKQIHDQHTHAHTLYPMA